MRRVCKNPYGNTSEKPENPTYVTPENPINEKTYTINEKTSGLISLLFYRSNT